MFVVGMCVCGCMCVCMCVRVFVCVCVFVMHAPASNLSNMHFTLDLQQPFSELAQPAGLLQGPPMNKCSDRSMEV